MGNEYREERRVSAASVAIIDYGLGNLRSVANAFGTLDCRIDVATAPASLKGASHIVLPGVGAFGDGIENLRRGGWIEALEEEVRVQKKPLLGICLGMQLLATTGTEHGSWRGLGWIDADVTRLTAAGQGLRVPHMGWNDVQVVGRPKLLVGLGERPCFYFVHSFAVVPEDRGVVSGLCEYGSDFAACIEAGNVFGVQFHPEKSHKVGISLLKNFLAVEPAAC
jgi:imidazole glycerol-phosphate synthase subunit HisH